MIHYIQRPNGLYFECLPDLSSGTPIFNFDRSKAKPFIDIIEVNTAVGILRDVFNIESKVINQEVKFMSACEIEEALCL